MGKLIAIPDSFKGSMSSTQVCRLIAEASSHVLPNTQVVQLPVADGGEGSVDCFLAAMGGQRIHATVQDPFGRLMEGCYGLLPDGTAVVELAVCAGLPLVGERLNPALTTTFGVGQLMQAAYDRGARSILCCLGGSATNDGGCGAAAACGVRFLDEDGNAFVPNGGTLSRIASIRPAHPLPGAVITVLCDVSNPLWGQNGAAWVYAPQKGADGALCQLLDEGLRHLDSIVRRDLGISAADLPGAGAAGGMGFGMTAFFGAQLRPGIEVVLDTVSFDTLVQDAELVITGEGRFDAQSMQGKVPVGVARRCKAAGVPCVVLTGDVEDGAEDAASEGVTAVLNINRHPAPLEEMKRRSQRNLLLTAESLFRLWKAARC